VEDHRVVERARRKLLVGAGSQRQRAELVLRGAEQTLAVSERRAASVGLAQARGEAHEEIGEHQRVAPIRGRLVHGRGVVTAGEEENCAAATDEVGERFVEVGVPTDVAGVVKQLVDDHVRQRGTVVAQQVGEQRVGEPPQGAKRHRRADERVVALSREARRFARRRAFREIALVRDAADDREPPCVWLQLQLIGRGHHMHHLIGVDAGDAGVAVAHAQVQRLTREATHGEHELEFLTRVTVEITASQHLLDRLPSPEDLCFLVTSTDDVCRRTGGEDETESQ
jgi:hypothetical protein